jgi:hypothetical protein
MEATLDFGGLAQHLGVSPPTLGTTSVVGDVITWLRESTGDPTADVDSACALASPVQEHRLSRLATVGSTEPGVLLAGMMALLGLVFLRFGRPEIWFRDEWVLSRAGGDLRLSVDRFVKEMRRRIAASMSLGEFLRLLYRDSIINQHLLVANSKWPNNTFRFERQGDRLHFHDLPARVSFQNSRFEALSTTIHELGLCGSLLRPTHPLTAEGRHLLHEGRLP